MEQKDLPLQVSVPQTSCESVYFEGIVTFQHAQYEKALAYFEQAAEQGYPAAYLWLGRLYHCVIGSGNRVVSEKWYDKVRSDIHWFKVQAQAGQADAQFNLGWCYHVGIGVEQDVKQALHYYRLAAEQGYAHAQNNLGVCYKNGQGVEQDAKQAVHYYRLAAEQGYADAQNNLAVCYENGEGVEQDVKQAVLHYYRLTAERVDADAKTNLDALLKTHPHLNVANNYSSAFFETSSTKTTTSSESNVQQARPKQ